MAYTRVQIINVRNYKPHELEIKGERFFVFLGIIGDIS